MNIKNIDGIVLRQRKGSKLSINEMDNNLIYLESIVKDELIEIKEIISSFKLEEDEHWIIINEKIDDILNNEKDYTDDFDELKYLLNNLTFDDRNIITSIIESKVNILNFISNEMSSIKTKLNILDDILNESSNIKKELEALVVIKNQLNKIENKIENINIKPVNSISNINIYKQDCNIPIDYLRPVSDISIIGIFDEFKLVNGRLIGKTGKDLKSYLPIIFNYEPIGEDIILVGIKDYKTKRNEIYLTYETKSKKSGVRKIFEAGPNIWDKYSKKINKRYEFNFKKC